MKQYFYLPKGCQRAIEAIAAAPDGWVVVLQEPTRTLEQNAAMWPILQAFSEQLDWPVNGKMCKMSPEEWKDVASAAFKKEQVRLAMAMDGSGVVMLGQRTSKMPKGDFSEWLEFLNAEAVHRGVTLHKPAVSL